MTLLEVRQIGVGQARSSRSSGAFARKAHQRRPILVVTGLAAEARLAAGPGVTIVMAGGDPARLRELLRARRQPDCRAVISIGIAGGLHPSCRVT